MASGRPVGNVVAAPWTIDETLAVGADREPIRLRVASLLGVDLAVAIKNEERVVVHTRHERLPPSFANPFVNPS